APLGYAYVLAVLASLVVALTVTPALCLLLLPRAVLHPSRLPGEAAAQVVREPPLLRWLHAGYDWLLRRLDRALPLAATVTALLLAAAVVAFFQFGGAFLPELRENHFVVHVRGVPGMSLPQSMETGKGITRALKDDKVRSIAQQAGRAELGEDTTGVEY